MEEMGQKGGQIRSAKGWQHPAAILTPFLGLTHFHKSTQTFVSDTSDAESKETHWTSRGLPQRKGKMFPYTKRLSEAKTPAWDSVDTILAPLCPCAGSKVGFG